MLSKAAPIMMHDSATMHIILEFEQSFASSTVTATCDWLLLEVEVVTGLETVVEVVVEVVVAAAAIITAVYLEIFVVEKMILLWQNRVCATCESFFVLVVSHYYYDMCTTIMKSNKKIQSRRKHIRKTRRWYGLILCESVSKFI